MMNMTTEGASELLAGQANTPVADGQSGGAGAAPAAAPTTEGAAAQVALQDWHKQFSTDPLDRDGPSLQDWVARKGFKDVNGLALQAREAEKALRGRVAIPTDPADTEGWGKVWGQLGRPDTADGYEIKAPDGYEPNPEFTKGFAQAMWGAGASKAQVSAAVDFYNAAVLGGMESDAAAQRALQQQQQANLRSSWGADYGKNIELARRGQSVLGLDAADVDAMGRAMGLDKALIKLAALGGKAGEDFFRSGEGGGMLTTLDPAEAKAKLDSWQADPANRAKLLAGDEAAKAAHKRLIDQLASATEAKNRR